MKSPLLFLFSLTAALAAFTPTTFAQEPATDLISSINGDSDFASDAQDRYFNREDCGLGGAGGDGGAGGMGGAGGDAGTGGTGGAGGMGAGGVGGAAGAGGVGGVTSASVAAAVPKAPSDTTFEIRLGSTASVNDVYLWVGGQNAACNLAQNRNETMGTCGEIAGNPRSVGNNFLVGSAGDLNLQQLLDARAGATELVDCETSGLTGTPYQIFAFRDQAPGSGDVDPSMYGVTDFFVDVEAPNVPLVNTNPQEASTFTITWGDPDPPDLIQAWTFYSSDIDDPTTATPLGITANLTSRSQSISSEQLGLVTGEVAYVFMNAFDQAFVSDDLGGNEGALSSGVMLTSVNVEGFCDATGDCSGCSASPISLAASQGPSSVAWALGLLGAIVCIRRFRR